MENKLEMLQALARALDAKKAFHITLLDIGGLSQIADFFLIAEGTVQRHLEAMAENLQSVAKTYGLVPLYREGLGSDWIVIDFAGIMAHLMLPKARELYAIETLWQESRQIELGL